MKADQNRGGRTTWPWAPDCFWFESGPSLAADVFDHDSPYGLGRNSEEVCAAVPVLVLAAVANEAQPGFMHQGRRLQRLGRCVLRQAANLRSSS